MSEQLTPAIYQPPVAKLLTAGKCKITDVKDWKDYRQKYGFTEADIPELIRMMTDANLWESGEPETWSVIHAWRALAQLKAVEAIAPLLSLWDDYEDDDWLTSEAPSVFRLIGIKALPVLTEFLANPSVKEWARGAITEGIAKIGQSEPEHRDACAEVLVRQLEAYNDNGPVLNGMLVSMLLDLQAVEAADLIEKVYAAKKIDDMIPGTWANVQVELGLKQASDFSPAELQTQFFKNLQASRLIANPEFNQDMDDVDERSPDWYGSPVTPSSFGEGLLEIPKQTSKKPVQGFSQGASNAAKGSKKKKKK